MSPCVRREALFEVDWMRGGDMTTDLDTRYGKDE
jgi:hypothetical protein